jgi:hypothetical protein
LNDEARWSLEKIAQFVATFERRFVTASVPASLNKYSVQTKLVYYPVWKDLGLPPYGVEWKEEALPQVA